jgi:outer membrane usher protein
VRRSLIFLGLAIVLGIPAISLFAQDAQIPLPLTFNEVPKGDVNVVIRGADIFVQPKDLENAGATGDMWQRVVTFARLRGGSRIEVGGKEFVSLAALSPLLTFKFDEANLSLSVNAAPELLVATALSVAGTPPKDIIYSKDTSTYLNYAATAGDVHSFFAENGVSIRGNLLLNSVSKAPNQSWARLMSSYNVDDRAHLRRFTLGDANVSSDSLGASTLIGGATVSRNFNLDPYFVRYPPLNFKGMALTPSRVDIYVNGAIVTQQDIPPGPFELRNVPVSAGAGNARVVVRDIFGHEQTMATPYYYSTEVLAQGVSEFVYSAGFIREDFGLKSFKYGDPAIVGFHRIGWSDDLTLGGRFEASTEVISGGPRATKRTRFGDIGGSVAFSKEKGGHAGAATELAYRYLGRRFSFGGSARLLSDNYANLALRHTDDRATADTSAFATYLAGRISYTLTWERTNLRDHNDSDGITLITNTPIGKRASIFASLGAVDEGTGAGRKPQLFAGISFLLGTATTANLSVDHRNGETQIVTDIQKAVGVGTGYGYRFQAGANSDQHTGTGALEYQTHFGRYELDFNPFESSPRPSLTASGGIVYQKGSFLLTRAVEDSFAVVRVPGVKNVRVYASNIPIGRTDSNGDLLVPNLLSYYGNRLSIDDRDIPLNYEVLATERTVAPPFRGGAYIEFPVRQIRTVTGSVVIAPDVLPAYGQLTVNVKGSEPFISPLGRTGEFYLENIPAGTYPATIDYKLGSCTFDLQIPSGNDSVVKLGRLTCQEAKTP